MVKKTTVVFLVLSCLLRIGLGLVVIEGRNATTDADHNHSEENHEFEELLVTTNSQLSDKLDISSVRTLLTLLNEQCLTAENIFEYLGLVAENGIDEHQFENASLLITLYLQARNTSTSCNGSEITFDAGEARFTIFTSYEVCRENVSSLISTISSNGKYVQSETATECFGSASIISACTTNNATIDEGLTKLISNMARGLCLLPDPAYFEEELFEHIGGQNGFASQTNLEALLGQLSIGGSTTTTTSTDTHNHRRRRRDINDNFESENYERDSHEEEDHAHEENQRCYTATDYLTIAGRQTDTTGNISLTKEGLASICPALVHQIITSACATTSVTTTSSTLTTAQTYGYATLAVLIISLLAFGGLLLFPSIGSNAYKLTMQFFIALGVGTLSGDALLHIIPEVVGLHNHDDSSTDSDEAEDKTYLYRLLVVIVGIYIFYLFENILRLYTQIKKMNLSIHHQDGIHGNHHEHPADLKAGSHHMIARTNMAMAEEAGLPGYLASGEVKNPIPEDSNSEANKGNNLCCGANTVAVMVFIGDVLHNFGDGLAIGVAFSTGWVSGLGTSIAIFCHELPHEFGDFAIYLNNGLSKWKALFFNFMAACFAFLGLYIGLSVSDNPDVRAWMFAIIAGMFLYISLVDVFHEMVEEVSKDHPLLQFFLQNLGLCLGWILLLLLALYEDQIRTSING